MARKKKDQEDDWLIEGYKKFLKFIMNATPDEFRELMKKAHYEECTGINPDTLEIRELTADDIRELQAEYDAL